MNRRQMVGAVVAMAAAGLVLTNTVKADDAPKAPKKTVKCMGGNACKGQGACGAKDGSHSCSGQNECKGKGWVMTATDKECTAAGGTVVHEKKGKKGGDEKAPS